MDNIQLNRDVALAIGEKPYIYQEDDFNHIIDHGGIIVAGWYQVWDGDDLMLDRLINYAEDPNEALKLEVQGFLLHLVGSSSEWTAYYTPFGVDIVWAEIVVFGKGSTPSHAICLARIALVAHISTPSDKSLSQP